MENFSIWDWAIVWTGAWAILGLGVTKMSKGSFSGWFNFTLRAFLVFVAWWIGRLAASYITDVTMTFWILNIVFFSIVLAILLKILGPIETYPTGSNVGKAFVMMIFGIIILVIINSLYRG